MYTFAFSHAFNSLLPKQLKFMRDLGRVSFVTKSRYLSFETNIDLGEMTTYGMTLTTG